MSYQIKPCPCLLLFGSRVCSRSHLFITFLSNLNYTWIELRNLNWINLVEDFITDTALILMLLTYKHLITRLLFHFFICLLALILQCIPSFFVISFRVFRKPGIWTVIRRNVSKARSAKTASYSASSPPPLLLYSKKTWEVLDILRYLLLTSWQSFWIQICGF